MALDEGIIEALERLTVASVGVTAIALAEAEPGLDMTLPQWRALVVVGRRSGTRVGDLATRLGVAVPTASRLVRRLEVRGLVTAQRDEADRRATLVRLSLAGEQVREAIMERRRRLVRDALAGAAVTASAPLGPGLAEIVAALHQYE